MASRADYIRRYYTLSCEDGIYTARKGGADAISSNSKAIVVREARRRWGHFNHQDEAEAFAETFPAGL